MATTIAVAQRLGRDAALLTFNELKRKMPRADLIATLHQPTFWEDQARLVNRQAPAKWAAWKGDASVNPGDTLLDVYVRAFVEEARRAITELRDNDPPDTVPNR